MNDIVIKVVAMALRNVPEANGKFSDMFLLFVLELNYSPYKVELTV